MSPSGDRPPPRPRKEHETGFTREPMVRWLDPVVLVESGLRVVLSSLFGSYADKREMHALVEDSAYSYDDGDAIWVDYAADLGDGFDSTYAIACLLARERLTLEGEGGALDTERGRVLVLGGDQVYPTPSRDAYENRFRGPYRAALPWTTPATTPHLFAIPGNHDWYDGLTNFRRVFRRDQWVGGWQVRQRRSYFALKLPHRWWILALDIQLDTYIDEPQLDYFGSLDIRAGDRVILVTGKPSWTKVHDGKVPDSYLNLRYFKEKIVDAKDARVAVTLTGDLHHYVRYAGDDGHHFITAGGGGAYLFPTHMEPEPLELPDRVSHRLAACYPPSDESRKMTRGAWKIPKLAPRLCVAIGVLDALFAAALFARLDGTSGSAAPIAIGAAIALALYLFAGTERKGVKLALGLGHAVVQLGLAAAAPVALHLLDADGALAGLAAAAGAGLIGFGLGGIAFGLYLIVTHPIARRHVNEVLACQAIPDWKGFLRLRIDASGLTIYPIGMRSTPRNWELDPDAAAAAPWFVPTDHRSLEWELMEQPIVVPPPAAPAGPN